MRIHIPSTACDTICVNGQGPNLANLFRVKRSFKPYQNEHDSVKEAGEMGKKACNIDPKITMKIFFH